MTNRQAIDTLRNELKERSADSDFTNQFLYLSLLKHAKWLIKREISAGRIYKNTSFFQLLPARDVIEVSTLPSCVDIKVNCKIYRTKTKLPEMWLDNNGPVVKGLSSIDGSTVFTLTTPNGWVNKMKDPYQKMSDEKYAFFEDGYFWFPKDNPHKVNIRGFYTEDITDFHEGCSECESSPKDCVRFLDKKFVVPDWVEAEMFAKALESLAGVTKRMQEDQQIDKNETRKN